MVEHWIVAPAVAGSSPVVHPKQKRTFARERSFLIGNVNGLNQEGGHIHKSIGADNNGG